MVYFVQFRLVSRILENCRFHALTPGKPSWGPILKGLPMAIDGSLTAVFACGIN